MANFEVPITITAELRPCYVNGEKALFHRWADKEIPIVKLNVINETEIGTKEIIDTFTITPKNDIVPPYTDFVLQKKVFGIVEYSDGTIAEVEPTSIRFDDRMIYNFCFRN